MSSKTIFFIISFFTLLAAATVTTITEHPPNPSPTNSGDCSQIGFTPLCCVAVIPERAAPDVTIRYNSLDIVIDPGTELLGLHCFPLVGGFCNGYVECCENTSLGTFINIGCVDIVI